jgi:mRNA-degrading endonuclease RelE of RelBE toxin-antitoxin system
MPLLTFIELQPFSSVRDTYLNDEEFSELQQHLAEHPNAGDVIPHSGGCRKLRWSAEGRGKRGGVRIIYFLRISPGQIVLVTMYAKNVHDNIDPRILRRLKEEFDRG